jgi:hypothetical protein
MAKATFRSRNPRKGRRRGRFGTPMHIVKHARRTGSEKLTREEIEEQKDRSGEVREYDLKKDDLPANLKKYLKQQIWRVRVASKTYHVTATTLKSALRRVQAETGHAAKSARPLVS